MATRHEKQEVAELVRNQDPQLWSRLTRDERDRLVKVFPQLVSMTVQRHSVFSGPIPAPDMIGEYDRIIPRGAERIMAMAENQSKHRQTLEAQVVASQNKQSERGQIFAFILALVFGGAGIWMGVLGHTGVAGTIFGVTVTGLFGAFILGKHAQHKDLKQKNSQNPQQEE